MRHRLTALLLALGVLLPSLARAAPFDFIYADQITMRAPLEMGWGVTLAGMDFGILVNTGSSPITAQDLDEADFLVNGVPVSPGPTITPILRPVFFYGYYLSDGFSPIAPGEGLGSVIAENTLLTALIAPNETFRNSSPAAFIMFQLNGTNNEPGVVRFDIRLIMGAFQADFPIFVTLIDTHEAGIEFTHATRVSGVAGPTPVKSTTWGSLKRLYR